MIEPILLTATRILTLQQGRRLTSATGFFFERDERLFLASSRHVFIDELSGHHPDTVQIDLHVDAENVTQSVGFTIPLYRDGMAVWRQGLDEGGEIDVAVVELDRAALPVPIVIQAFTPAHLTGPSEQPEVGAQVLVPGFPLGFHDTLHNLPVVRQAIIASSFGMRFKGEGYFLTDARTHRGSSGAPVVMRRTAGSANPVGGLGWWLLGVHSARLDAGGRDLAFDEALGLNCAWYADILMTLTAV